MRPPDWIKRLPSEGEAELLAALWDYKREHGRVPSLRFAATLLGLTHGAVQQRLVGLMLLGYARREGRALVLRPGIPVVGEVG